MMIELSLNGVLWITAISAIGHVFALMAIHNYRIQRLRLENQYKNFEDHAVAERNALRTELAALRTKYIETCENAVENIDTPARRHYAEQQARGNEI